MRMNGTEPAGVGEQLKSASFYVWWAGSAIGFLLYLRDGAFTETTMMLAGAATFIAIAMWGYGHRSQAQTPRAQ